MTASALPHLRPLKIGQLLDQAIRVYRRNFLKFIGIIAVAYVPLALAGTLVSGLTSSQVLRAQSTTVSSGTNPFEIFGMSYFVGLGGACLLGILSFVLVQGVATAALTRAVADYYLGESTSMLDAYRRMGRAWQTLIAALLIGFLISLGLLVWFMIPCIGWFTGFGMLSFWGLAVVPLIAPIVVLERQSPGGAVRRAWDLTRRRFWWVVGFVIILAVFNQLIVSGPVYLASAVFQWLAKSLTEVWGFDTLYAFQLVTQSLLTVALNLFYLPLQLTAMTLLYFDLRVRTEGFDLALLAENMLGEQNAADQALALSPPPESSGLISGTELGYFALISLGLLGLFVVLAFVGQLLVMAFMGSAGGF